MPLLGFPGAAPEACPSLKYRLSVFQRFMGSKQTLVDLNMLTQAVIAENLLNSRNRKLAAAHVAKDLAWSPCWYLWVRPYEAQS